MANKNNRGLGILLIIAGIVWIALNTGAFRFDFNIIRSLFTLWPLILVAAGLSMVFGKQPLIKAVIWIVTVVIILGYGYFYGGTDTGRSMSLNSFWEEDLKSAVKTADIKLSFGGTDADIKALKGGLLYRAGFPEDMEVGANVSYERSSSHAVVELKQKSSVTNIGFNVSKPGRSSIELNDSIVWEKIEMMTGAINGKIDLSGIRCDDISVDAGAANISMYMDEPEDVTGIRINAGASAITLYLPEKARFRLKADNSLVAVDIDGFKYNKEGKYYTSSEYDSDESRFEIELNMGVGSFEIKSRR